MSIFADEAAAVADIRANRFSIIPPSYIDSAALTDAMIWEALRSAELEVSRRLTIPLEPTQVFADEPTQAEIDALAGKPYLVEPGYDMPPDFFSVSSFGALKLRMRPVIAVQDFRFVYPSLGNSSQFVVPANWIRVDKKYGHVNLFPSATPVNAQLSIFQMQMMGAGYTVPLMIRVKYTCGIDANSAGFVDVLDIVKRVATLRILHDSFIPSSGSISADGLSQSTSVDTDKFQSAVDARLDDLKQQLLGVLCGVM